MNVTLKSPERSPLFDLFIEPEAYGPIFDVLTSILPPADILAVRRTCKDAEHIFRHLQLSQWNVDVRLKRFFMDAKGFRQVLGENNALVSGSFALQFFARRLWKESDLDIFVENGSGAENMQSFILEKEGYTLLSKQRGLDLRDYHLGNIHELSTFERQPGNVETYRKVQIIATQVIPKKAILRGVYSTALMNVITWNKAYCLFPKTTFLGEETYPLIGQQKERYVPLHAKLESRGWPWTTQSPFWEHGRSWTETKDCWLGTREARGDTSYWWRRIGDKRSWVIPLATDGINTLEIPDSVIDFSEFRLKSVYFWDPPRRICYYRVEWPRR